MCTIVGTPGPDVLQGTPGNDVICGGGGADRILGGGGDDILRGGRGNDVLLGGGGDDIVWGGAGNDVLIGQRGADELYAGIGRDVLRGGRGKDLLDARHGPKDVDRLACGTGRDVARADTRDRVSSSCEVVRPDRPAGTDEAPNAVSDARTVLEDSPATVIDVLANDLDPDGGPMAVTAVSQPARGTTTVTSSGGSVSYRPAADYCSTAPRAGADVEPDLFTYTLNGGSSATVRVTVTCVDDAPTAVDDAVSVVEDDDAIDLDVLANDLDVDGGPIRVEGVTRPRLGSVAVLADGTGLTYRPDGDVCTPQGAPDSFTYTLNGGSSADVAVTISCQADAPVVVTSEGTTTYVEDAAASLVDPGVVVADADGTLSGATVRITAGFDASQDVLALSGTHPGIVASFSGGVLRLQGAASVADYQVALRQVTYRNSSQAPTTSSRTVAVRVTDEADLEAAGQKHLAVEAVNDAPLTTVPGAQALAEDAPATAVTGVSVTDVDAGTNDVETTLSVPRGILTVGTGSGSRLTGDGTGTVTVTGTLTQVNGALAQLGYRPEADGSGDRRITVVTDDLGSTGTGGSRSDTDTILVTVEAVNDAPVITAPSGTITQAEDTLVTFEAGGSTEISVADVDAGTADIDFSATASSGRLTLDPTRPGVVVTGAGTDTLTLTGVLADVNDALDGMTYTPEADATGAVSVTMSAEDDGNTGSGGSKSAAPRTVDLAFTPVNDAPRLTPASGAVAYTEGGSPTVLAADLAVADPDHNQAVGARVVVTDGLQAGDVLAAAAAPGISSSYSSTTGTLTLTGTASLTSYRSVLRSVTFATANDDPAASRTIEITVDDGDDVSSPATRTVALTPTNNAPTVATSTGTADHVEGEPGVAVDPAVVVADPDSPTLAGATVRIATGFDSATDRLTYVNSGGITGSYSSGTGVLTLTGTASAPAYQAALRSITFRAVGDDPSAQRRTVTFTVRDGDTTSTESTRAVTVEAVNDAPVAVAPAAASTDEDTSVTFAPDTVGALLVSDVDARGGDETAELTATHGSVTLGDTTGLMVTGNGTTHVTATGTVAALNAGLAGTVFTPTEDHSGQATLTLDVSDNGHTGTGGTRTAQGVTAITVAAVNDAPAITAPGSASVDQDATYTFAARDSISLTDVDAGTGEVRATLTVSNGRLSLAQVTGLTFFAGDGTSDAAIEVSGTLANLDAALDGLTYQPAAGYFGTDRLDLTVDDQGNTGVGGAKTASRSVTITVVENAGPSIVSLSPPQLVPGATATLTGRGFSPTASDNTVTIGGAPATVTAASTTTLTVTVPCVSSSAAVAVAAKVGAVATNTVQHPLQVSQRSIGVGQSLILDNPTDVGCNELPATGGNARYLISAYSASTSPSSNSPFALSGDVLADPADPTPASTSTDSASQGRGGFGSSVQVDTADGDHGDDHGLALDEAPADDPHTDLLEENREQYELLREEFGTDGVQRRGAQLDTTAADLPLSRTFRISNINATGNATICSSYYTASATRVYADGKLVIYEDDATPAALKAANNPLMADHYEKIGDQFNSDMEPIIRDNFGDILRRDAVTDNNGVMIALATPRINTSFPGVAGFVVTCDQFPNDDTSTPPVGGPYIGTGSNGASNFGEFFYLYQPTNTNAGYDSGSPSNWYRTVRSTFIHESKHVASQAARVANDAPAYEAAWLEEGTARLAEELWARQSVDSLPWKGNNGYGSAADPVSLYCDLRPGAPECDANPRRPASVMQRHFASLYTHLFGANARLLSPFGATASDNASYYYAVSWSFIRYSIDRYGTSEADFLTALTQSTSTGATNLSERAGVATDQLLGRWSTALALDDHPLMTTSSNDTTYATWNFRSIYAGLNRDAPTSYTLAYPVVPTQFAFGKFTAAPITTLRGGGVLWYELSGSQAKAQLLRMQGTNGTTVPGTVRLAITRIQ